MSRTGLLLHKAHHGGTASGDEGGFTLVELLVVALIIGVLATLAIPAFFGVRERAWNAAAETDARTMSKIATTLQTDQDIFSWEPPQSAPDVLVILSNPGFEGSPEVTHGLCSPGDGSFAVAARHQNSLTTWLVDFEGRLVGSAESGVTDALDALVGCDLSVITTA